MAPPCCWMGSWEARPESLLPERNKTETQMKISFMFMSIHTCVFVFVCMPVGAVRKCAYLSGKGLRQSNSME